MKTNIDRMDELTNLLNGLSLDAPYEFLTNAFVEAMLNEIDLIKKGVDNEN